MSNTENGNLKSKSMMPLFGGGVIIVFWILINLVSLPGDRQPTVEASDHDPTNASNESTQTTSTSEASSTEIATIPKNPQAETPKFGTLRAGKVLFLGNSITLHGPAPQIGWEGNWGMAASAERLDYVHLLTADLAETISMKPEIMVRNIADFERGHEKYDFEMTLKSELAFKPDLVIIAIGENTPQLATDELQMSFSNAFKNLLKTLQQNGQPTLFVRGSFYQHPVADKIMETACKDTESTFINISALGLDEKNKASSERKIEHAGVASHPGDQGMRAIADAIFAAIKAKASQSP